MNLFIFYKIEENSTIYYIIIFIINQVIIYNLVIFLMFLLYLVYNLSSLILVTISRFHILAAFQNLKESFCFNQNNINNVLELVDL